MNCFKAKITANKKIAPGHYILSFKAPKIAKRTKPGQFFNVRVSGSFRPLLRRPFSAHRIGKDNIEILYKVVGKATDILSGKKKDDALDILGPLGSGFDSRFAFHDSRNAVLVAGGHGVAPLYALAEKFASGGARFTVLIGARTKEHIVCDKNFRKLGARVCVATENGSRGRKGPVTALLNDHLSTAPVDRGIKSSSWVYACGPKPMLKAVAKITERYGAPCQVSLEEYIACGIGACLGCAIKTKSGYKMVCKDGPVFDSREIIWD